jgi:GTP-binding protein HflX
MPDINEPTKILLVYLARPKMSRSEMEKDITELWQLVETRGNATIVDIITQHEHVTSATYIGKGKAEEVATYLTEHPIDIVLLNDVVRAGQKFNLLKSFWGINPTIQVWDRVDLILSIFSKHAKTTEANLQIELARMHHMGPRIFGMGMELSRQGGGIGTRGLGETNTELMERHWKREIKKVKDQLKKITETRQRQMDHRKSLGLKTVSIVGYTNAGKTSLFNVLTHKKHLVENALFATLDSTVGEIYMTELGEKVVITDTIGFISNLPPNLIEAFTSTLLESIHADVILHVIDATDRDIANKIEAVNIILDQLKIAPEKEVLVFNKIDEVTAEDRQKLISKIEGQPHVLISTKTHEGIDTLTNDIFPKFLHPTVTE